MNLFIDRLRDSLITRCIPITQIELNAINTNTLTMEEALCLVRRTMDLELIIYIMELLCPDECKVSNQSLSIH